MRIIARRTLREFVESRRAHKDHAALKAALDVWFDELKKAQWSTAADVKRSYATASIAVDFEKGIVWVKWIGTHREYDKIDVREVQHDD